MLDPGHRANQTHRFQRAEPTSQSRTRLATLDPVTRRDAGGGFFGEENVPHQAITMGVGTILEARKILIMAFGEHKAPVVQKALEEEMTDAVAASFLQRHDDTAFILDQAAAGDLTLFQRPWELGPVEWTPALIRKAVIGLRLQVEKALLKLSDAAECLHSRTRLDQFGVGGVQGRVRVPLARQRSG